MATAEKDRLDLRSEFEQLFGAKLATAGKLKTLMITQLATALALGGFVAGLS